MDLDVKLFFALTNAIFDAGICAWDNKCRFASVRPLTALRFLYGGQKGGSLGGSVPGHAHDRRSGLAPLPAEYVPDAAVP